jgi:collagen type IV alpha
MSSEYFLIYFFVSIKQHRGSGADGGGQSLQSPGSCLESFRTTPFIECSAMGKCQFTQQKISFWLSVINDYDQFNMPSMKTTQDANSRQRVSRCRVCMKMTPKEGQVRN